VSDDEQTPAPEIMPVVAEEPAPVAEHAPLVAPESEPGPEPLATQIAPEPTPTVSAAAASFSRPVGSAAPTPTASPAGVAPADRPEVLVGAAFAGGLVLALIIKRLGR
jgi:hypothetical protein